MCATAAQAAAGNKTSFFRQGPSGERPARPVGCRLQHVTRYVRKPGKMFCFSEPVVNIKLAVRGSGALRRQQRYDTRSTGNVWTCELESNGTRHGGEAAVLLRPG